MRALMAFIALPGIVALAVPAMLAAMTATHAISWLGIAPAAVGTAALVWCALEFHRVGRGTLAPWAPPRRLVTSGPYARSRNPMYLSVLLVLTGWTFSLRSVPHMAYAAVMAVAFHVRVVAGEEPRLAQAFDAEWLAYRASVPRWLPPLPRWSASLWLAAGLLLGAALWLFSSALLGHVEPWDAQMPVWSLSWPVVGALGAAARQPRGLLLPLGYAAGQAAAALPVIVRSEFGVLGLAFLGGGLVVALSVTLALQGVLALWRRFHRFPNTGGRR
jgi:protein-S-isoprenylcysteine O-methyltransferase Ste14